MILTALFAALVVLTPASGDTVPPAENDELRAQVEQVFTDYLATIEPVGSGFYAQTCEWLVYDYWSCFAIDAGVVSVSIAPDISGALEVTLAERYDAFTGTELPLP